MLTNARSWASRLSRRTGSLGTGAGSTRPRRDVHRFDGERPFVARGGATVGSMKASWSTAELSLSSTHVVLRSRPSGLFGDVRIERGEVASMGVRASELGTGITFGETRPDVVFWPTDTRQLLEEFRDRGWPAGCTG